MTGKIWFIKNMTHEAAGLSPRSRKKKKFPIPSWIFTG